MDDGDGWCDKSIQIAYRNRTFIYIYTSQCTRRFVISNPSNYRRLSVVSLASDITTVSWTWCGFKFSFNMDLVSPFRIKSFLPPRVLWLAPGFERSSSGGVACEEMPFIGCFNWMMNPILVRNADRNHHPTIQISNGIPGKNLDEIPRLTTTCLNTSTFPSG